MRNGVKGLLDVEADGSEGGSGLEGSEDVLREE